MFLINSSMNEKIKSLNDLTIALHVINKKYKIEDFIEAYKTAVGSSSMKILKDLKMDTTTNPFQKILSFSSKISEEMIESMVAATAGLSGYNYNEYLDECNSLREVFLKDRKTYFSSKVVFNTNKKKDGTSSIFELSGTADLVLGDFLDKVLVRIFPGHLDVVYEDLSGKKIKSRLRHKHSIVTSDHVEAPLIDRYHGINAYDSFLLRSYYDAKKNEWVYIPIRLVVKVDCDDELLETIESID